MNRLPTTPSPDLATPPPPPEVPGPEGASEPPPKRIGQPPGPHTPLSVKGLLDVVLLVVAAPVLLVAGVSAPAYLIAAGAWIVLRLVGVGIDRLALAIPSSRIEIGLRLAYLLGRLFGLAVMVVLLRNDDGRHAALAALLVILVAFTVELTLSVIYRPRKR